MKSFVAVSFVGLFFLMACHHGPEEVKAPSGRTAYSIACRRTQICIDTANQTCPAGYEVVSIGNDGEFVASTTVLHSPKEMMIRCKAGPQSDVCPVDPLMMSNQDHARWMMDPSYCPR